MSDIRQFEATRAYVQFEVRAVEDRHATQMSGQYVGRDVDYVLVTPVGGNNIFEGIAIEWLENKRQARDPFYKEYKECYDAWKDGQEEPVNGTSIRDWANISPAQRKLCESLHIRTVEDIAGLPESGLERLGMGARALQDKARTWLSSVTDRGKITEELAALKIKLEASEQSNKSKDDTIRVLQMALDAANQDARRNYPTSEITESPLEKKETLKLSKVK